MPGYVDLRQLVTRLCQTQIVTEGSEDNEAVSWFEQDRIFVSFVAFCKNLIAQFDVPVSEIDKMLPEIVLRL